MIQSSYCPAITLVGETSVSGSLQAMDCHINAAVQTGYDRLFGAGGVFGHALQAMLIIYVALIAFGFLTGPDAADPDHDEPAGHDYGAGPDLRHLLAGLSRHLLRPADGRAR
ncbi:MAG: hypothetical protein WDN06_06960 [Asticcacaulis sp.]